jgi:hypothetical protein
VPVLLKEAIFTLVPARTVSVIPLGTSMSSERLTLPLQTVSSFSTVQETAGGKLRTIVTTREIYSMNMFIDFIL